MMENTFKGNMFLENESDGHYFINFMLLKTFKNNAESVLEQINRSINGMNAQDKEQKKIIEKRQWVIKEINKFLENRNK
ncbi:hypothetical protein PVOR_15264 [Paenibacillus vortex V453]|uniref:Uncharacterized protein n=2 Tax=Paenibacillus TaxID=44249 RepID=A0A2R9SUG3_9BACL|nr:hypothetical protein PVOR_15264 [Paenibacillus vortex V453]